MIDLDWKYIVSRIIGGTITALVIATASKIFTALNVMFRSIKKWCGKIKVQFVNFYKSRTKKHFRLLMDGLFTTEMGNCLVGSFSENTGTLHLMPPCKIILFSGTQGDYAIITASNTMQHSDQGTFKPIQTGSILKLFNAKLFNTVEWVKLKSNPIQVAEGWKFDTEPYMPTELEENAVISQ